MTFRFYDHVDDGCAARSKQSEPGGRFDTERNPVGGDHPPDDLRGIGLVADGMTNVLKHKRNRIYSVCFNVSKRMHETANRCVVK